MVASAYPQTGRHSDVRARFALAALRVMQQKEVYESACSLVHITLSVHITLINDPLNLTSVTTQSEAARGGTVWVVPMSVLCCFSVMCVQDCAQAFKLLSVNE
eukprot:4816-Heterococcus_DN1.PRE.4